MTEWAGTVCHETPPAVVFAQEVPSDAWLQVWRGAGFRVRVDDSDRWKIRSALITAGDLDVEDPPRGVFLNADYHGSYMASGLWRNAPGGPVVLASVHASPNYAEPERYGWMGELPSARHGGGDPRWPANRLWDSDMVSASLLQIGRRFPVFAGGDFNESRLDDPRDLPSLQGGWGHDYFSRLEAGGLSDVSLVGGEERLVTRGALQLDHFLATADAVARLAPSRPRLDLAWEQPGAGSLSDHTALWIDLNLGPVSTVGTAQ